MLEAGTAVQSHESRSRPDRRFGQRRHVIETGNELPFGAIERSGPFVLRIMVLTDAVQSKLPAKAKGQAMAKNTIFLWHDKDAEATRF